MKIKYQHRYTEIGQLNKDHDFLKKQLDENEYLSNGRLFDFLKQLEIRISKLINERNLDRVTPSLTRKKTIEFKGSKVELDLNIDAHNRAYFLFTIYQLGHQCYNDGNALIVETDF